MGRTLTKKEPSDVAAFVLAGGASSRMGSDKALVRLAGRPLIEYALGILRAAGLPASIAGARSQLSCFGHVIEDSIQGLGPLSGVCAALASTSARFGVFLSVDAPLLPASLISYLLSQAEISNAAVTLASVAGFPQTFPAVVDRAALPTLQAELDNGRSSCIGAFRTASAALRLPFSIVPAELVAQSGHAVDARGLPPAFWFLNVNTQADLDRAEKFLARGMAYSDGELDG